MLKESIRILLVSISILIVSPVAFLSFLEKQLTRGSYFFILGGQFFSIFPGVIGDFLRTAYYILTLDYCHYTVVISFGSYFSKRKSIVRRRSGFGAYCVIGMSDIGVNVRVASRVSIISGLYEHGNSSNVLDKRENEGSLKQIKIGDNTWIGESSTVGADVGSNCIVGAGAVVLNDIPNSSLAMGNPARLLPISKKNDKNTSDIEKVN